MPRAEHSEQEGDAPRHCAASNTAARGRCLVAMIGAKKTRRFSVLVAVPIVESGLALTALRFARADSIRPPRPNRNKRPFLLSLA